MLTNQTRDTNQQILNRMVSRYWRALVERVVLLALVVVAVNLVFTYCGGLFGIVEFLLASADSTLFIMEVVIALTFTWALLSNPFLIERCLQLFNPVPAYRTGLLAQHSRLILPTPVVRSVPQTVHGCRAPPAISI